MKSESNAVFNQEVEQNFNRLFNKPVDKSLKKQTITSWKGVDDRVDNVAGVKISNEQGLSHQIILVQLDCESDYIELARAISEKAFESLTLDGYTVEFRPGL
jgi:hypothetical protein